MEAEKWEDRDHRRRGDSILRLRVLPCATIENVGGGSFPNADFEVSGSSHKHILMHCSGVDIHGSWSFGFAYLLMVGRKQNRVQEHRSFGCSCFAMGGNDYV